MSTSSNETARQIELMLTRMTKTWSQQGSSHNQAGRANLLTNLRDAAMGIPDTDPVRQQMLGMIDEAKAKYVTSLPAEVVPAAAPAAAPAPAPAAPVARAPSPVRAHVEHKPVAAKPAAYVAAKPAAKKPAQAPVPVPAYVPPPAPAPVPEPDIDMETFEKLSLIAGIVSDNAATFEGVADDIPERCRNALGPRIRAYVDAGKQLLVALNDQAANVAVNDAPAAAHPPAPARRAPPVPVPVDDDYEDDDEEDIDDM